MNIWYEERSERIYRNRPLLAYCPKFCEIGYQVVTWNGNKFVSETHGEDIDPYVEQWSTFLEAD